MSITLWPRPRGTRRPEVETVGPYRLEERLGGGGTGEVRAGDLDPPTVGAVNGPTTGGTPAVRYVPAADPAARPAWPTTSVPSPREATSPRPTPPSAPTLRPPPTPRPPDPRPPNPLPPNPLRPHDAVSAPHRARGARWVVLGAVPAGVVAVLAALLLITGTGTTPGPAPVATVAPSPAPSRLAAAFPDIVAPGSSCAPYPVGPDEYVTSTGARPRAVIRCDYGAAVPGGYIYYTEWPTTADARRWQADQASRGPSLDGGAQWSLGGGAPQGPLHTHASTDGTVYATGAYADRSYGFDIVTRSLADSHRLLPAVRLLPAAQVPA